MEPILLVTFVAAVTTLNAAPTPALPLWPEPPRGSFSYKCCPRFVADREAEVCEPVRTCSNIACLQVDIGRFINGEICCRNKQTCRTMTVTEYQVRREKCKHLPGPIEFPLRFHSPPLLENAAEYPNLIECRYQWHFNETTLVNLTFNPFHLELGGKNNRCNDDFCCLNDYVKLTFFKRRSSESYEKVCGEHESLNWHRKKVQKLTLEFATDGSETRRGFEGVLKRAEQPKPLLPPPLTTTETTSENMPTVGTTLASMEPTDPSDSSTELTTETPATGGK